MEIGLPINLEDARLFQKDLFIEACKAAVADGQIAIREIVLAAVADPSGVIAELGEPNQAGVYPMYQSDDLTIINFVWAPYMTLLPHNHNMFAVIGLYGGREDNMFWRKIGDGGAGGNGEGRAGPELEAAGAESMGSGQVATLGPDIIHSVANPIAKLTSAIHVYGGNFFNPPKPRAQWDHETLIGEPWDMAHTHKVFHEAGVRYDAGIAAGI